MLLFTVAQLLVSWLAIWLVTGTLAAFVLVIVLESFSAVPKPVPLPVRSRSRQSNASKRSDAFVNS